MIIFPDDGAVCISIPITSAVNPLESKAIAGGDEKYVIEMDSFEIMTLKVLSVYNDVCELISE